MIHDVPVVIMAGGKGERMRPFTNFLPKPLLMYRGKTMIENVILQFYEKGFRKFFIMLCNYGPLIATYLSTIKLEFEVNCIYEQSPMGTAGGLWLLRDKLKGDFILCNCDNLGDFNYWQAIAFHRTEQAAITMFVKKERYTIPFGLVHTDGEKCVRRIDEKPISDCYISTGIYVVDSAVIRYFLDGTRKDMPALVNQVLTEQKVCFFDIGDMLWADMSLGIDKL